jgi:hypothetical protein
MANDKRRMKKGGVLERKTMKRGGRFRLFERYYFGMKNVWHLMFGYSSGRAEEFNPEQSHYFKRTFRLTIRSSPPLARLKK